MTNNIHIDVLHEKVKQLEKNCENIYDQITDLRTTVQEIYGEISQSDRFYAEKLLNFSERLEEMAKYVSTSSKNLNPSSLPPNITLTVSPNINPTLHNSQDNSSINKENSEKEKKESILDFLNLDIKSFFFFLIVGILVVIGLIYNSTDQIDKIIHIIK